jgi:hypothetical protein
MFAFARHLALASLLASSSMLAGCEWLGIEPASALAARKDAEARAVGAACRHAGRAIEDCYALNRRVDKGAMFAGWRDMNDYMRDNKIDEVAPLLANPTTPPDKVAAGRPADEPAAARKR